MHIKPTELEKLCKRSSGVKVGLKIFYKEL